jgi:hypothetical protein
VKVVFIWLMIFLFQASRVLVAGFQFALSFANVINFFEIRAGGQKK